MGEVYRARDTRLGREVAIKVSAERFSERFEREARVISSLNHPNICTLHDVGPNFLVMELVEGEMLSDRIRQGPIPVGESLVIARQIADALEAAHEKGIVHRDLKPGNVIVKQDASVKVLDFGLAKVEPPRSSGGDPENSPTLTMSATQMGVILGTASYMAPEQARGKPVDKRADIWAFGVVLYEMVTGKRLFTGEDLAEILASVVKSDPDLSAAPRELRRLLEKCLEKDPRKRLRDISGVELLLEPEPEASPQLASPSARAGKTWLWPAISAALAVIAAIGYWAPWRAVQPANRPLMRFNVDLGPEAARSARSTVVLSPDGSRIAFTGRLAVFTRRLDQPDATRLFSGTAAFPDLCFSPDGDWVAFNSGGGNFKKIAVAGGSAVTLGGGRGLPWGTSWSDDGRIFVGGLDGLASLPAAGGTFQKITDFSTLFPQVLPGSKAVLVNTDPKAAIVMDDFNIEALELASGKRKTLVEGGYFPRYAPTSADTGHLLYMSHGVLFAVAFDPRSLELLGTARPILSDVGASTDMQFGGGQFAVSGTGTLVYLSGSAEGRTHTISWLDAAGRLTPLVAEPGVYGAPRLSPDGRQLAYISSVNGAYDVWVQELAGGTPRQLTFLGKVSSELAWAPDSQHLAYSDGKALWWIRADGNGEARLLKGDLANPRPNSFAPFMGKQARLLFVRAQKGLPDLLTLPIDLTDPERPRAGDPEPFLTEGATVEVDGAFSPDGKFIAYSSNEQGAEQVFVRPFPGPGGLWKVSTNGGVFPAWSPTTKELLYLGGDDTIMAASYTIQGDSFSVGAPHQWSSRQVWRDSVRQNFDVWRDGKRVVMFPLPVVEDAGGSLHATFLLNFFDQLRRRDPAGGR